MNRALRIASTLSSYLSVFSRAVSVMTRRWTRSIVGPVIVAIVAAEGCSDPTAPSLTSFTISGRVTEYQGGPVSGMRITVGSIGSSLQSTLTDEQGCYTVSGRSWGRVAITSDFLPTLAYTTMDKYVEPRDQVLNFVAHPWFSAPLDGSTVAGTIRGDEIIAADEFGGRCALTACKLVSLLAVGAASPSKVEIRLRWSDPSRQLAIYIPVWVPLFPPPYFPGPAKRYCCSSELVATYEFNFDSDLFAIGFEQADGRPPHPADAQKFELTISPIQ